MKKKNLLMTAIAIFGLATITMAQVPSYVPTTGLVGWWPFTGNANDLSVNGNNGTVNGASLTTDRFANTNSSYIFNNNYIITSFAGFGQNIGRAFSLWAIGTNGSLLAYGGQYDLPCPPNGDAFQIIKTDSLIEINVDCSRWIYLIPNYSSNTWYHFVFSFPNNVNNLSGVQVYCNSNLLNVNSTQGNGAFSTILDLPVNFGRCHRGNNYYNGIIDDIGIWNRALTEQEITDLYNSCELSIKSQPTSQTINISNKTQFIVGASDPNATYRWQTDLGVGFQNLNSVGQYSGTTNDTLTILNVTMSNNNQPFRCIISSGDCLDTSNVAVLTVNNNVGINENSQDNLFSVFPNPAKSQINVKADAKLLGSIYTVYDNTGKLVLTGKINSENTVIELGNLSGGIYLFSVGENLKQTFKVIKE